MTGFCPYVYHFCHLLVFFYIFCPFLKRAMEVPNRKTLEKRGVSSYRALLHCLAPYLLFLDALFSFCKSLNDIRKCALDGLSLPLVTT
jgi:hypothetical protein